MKRVLETIVSFRRQALHQQDVGLGKPFQRGLQGSVLQIGHSTKQWVGEVASDHSTDLRHLARRAEPIKPRHKRLLQCRGDSLGAALLAALQQKPRHFLDEQRYAASSLGHTLDHLLR